jgi:hypothetical protein
MKPNKQQSADAGKKPLEKEKPPEREAGEESEESCRCKEVAKKTPLDLLKLMVSDLAFWKKAKGRK